MDIKSLGLGRICFDNLHRGVLSPLPSPRRTRPKQGADWEGNLITLAMYDSKSKTTKFVPVFFASQDEQFIPDPIRSHTHYLLDCAKNYAKLYAFLTGQADVKPTRKLRWKCCNFAGVL
jgi:hypothetical protein